MALSIIAILTIHQVYGAIIHPYRIGWDTALHLQAAQLITQGKIPYVDMFDVNPPLIWYLDTIPAYFSILLDLPATQTFSFFLTSVILYSSCSCLYLLFKSKSSKELIFFVPFTVGLIVFNFFLRFDFGQREDIFVLLYLPFFVLRWLRWNDHELPSRNLSILFGLIGGVGICLKPHFLIPAFLVELVWLIDKRNWKKLVTVETIACFSAGVIYLLHFLFVPAQMRDNYFGYLVPAFKLGYHFWDVSTAAMFSPPDKRNVFFIMVLGVVFGLALRKRSSLFVPLSVFAVSSNIPYLIQFKGWAYHNQPVYAAATILGYMVVGYILFLIGRYIVQNCAVPEKLMLYLVPIFIGGIAFYDAYTDTVKVNSERKVAMETFGLKGKSPIFDLDSPFLRIFEKYYRKGDSVVFMSNGVTPGYPTLTQLQCPNGSRHLHCVILSVLHYVKGIRPQTDETRRISEKMDLVVKQYGDDIKKNRPRLVFVQIGPVQSYLEPYDFEEKYLSGYEKIDELVNFKVFLRVDNG